MPRAEFLNIETGETIEGLNFGGNNQKAYLVGTVVVFAPEGGESISYADNVATLNPLDLICDLGDRFWDITDYNYHGDGTWDVDVKNNMSGEVKTGILAFNENGAGYDLECEETFVMASCGGYKIEDTWDGQTENDWKRLVHTDDTLPHEILSYKCSRECYWDGSNCELLPTIMPTALSVSFVYSHSWENCPGRGDQLYIQDGLEVWLRVSFNHTWSMYFKIGDAEFTGGWSYCSSSITDTSYSWGQPTWEQLVYAFDTPISYINWTGNEPCTCSPTIPTQVVSFNAEQKCLSGEVYNHINEYAITTYNKRVPRS